MVISPPFKIIRGYPCDFVAFFENFKMTNIGENRCWHVRLMLSKQVLAQWWHPVASSETLDLLHWAMRAVLYRCIAVAIKIKTAGGQGAFVRHCRFCHLQ